MIKMKTMMLKKGGADDWELDGIKAAAGKVSCNLYHCLFCHFHTQFLFETHLSMFCCDLVLY